jgi:micrococcal nuclease
VDGDSLVVQLASGPVEVRLHAADAPEYDQPGGREAQRALAAHLRRGRSVTLEPVSQDHYERMVAVVRLGDENVDAWLIRRGHAWAYRRYTSDRRYCEWEEEARAAGLGVWAGGKPLVAPWDWRRSQRDPRFRPQDRSEETLATCLGALRRPR